MGLVRVHGHRGLRLNTQKEFKANKLVNFKNVPKAFRYQFMMAHDMLQSDGQKSNMFFYQGDEVDTENDADFELVNTFGHLKREF